MTVASKACVHLLLRLRLSTHKRPSIQHRPLNQRFPGVADILAVVEAAVVMRAAEAGVAAMPVAAVGITKSNS